MHVQLKDLQLDMHVHIHMVCALFFQAIASPYVLKHKAVSGTDAEQPGW